MQNPTWSPEHPLALGFSVLDQHVPAIDEPHPLTATFGERLLWWTESCAQFLKPNSIGRPNSYFSGVLHGFRASVVLTEAPRHADRSQWRIHVASDPPFMRLADFQQDAARILLRELCELATAWQETEDVDVASAT